jgi:hypothetical protein
MTTSVDRADPDGTAITTAETDGTAITTAETDGTAITTADPVTTMASAGPVTMAEAAATAKRHFPAQVTVAAPRPSPLCVMSGSARYVTPSTA